MEKDIPRWYVMRAYKCEAKAEKILLESGIRYFVPKIYVLRTSLSRGETRKKKRVLVPAIPGIVFVHASQLAIVQLKKTYNFLQFVTRKILGVTEYLTVPEQEMDNFIKVASHYESSLTYYTPDEIQNEKGIRVRIHGGAFDGVEGTLLKVKGKRSKRLVVSIENVSAIAIAEISPDLIEIIK